MNCSKSSEMSDTTSSLHGSPFRASILKRPPKRVRIIMPPEKLIRAGSIKNHKRLETKRPGIPSEYTWKETNKYEKYMENTWKYQQKKTVNRG